MKAFVITIDALMAITIASIMLASILFMIPQASTSNFDKKQLFNLGNDILSVMDTSRRLSYYVGQSAGFVNEDLGFYVGLLPKTFCGNLTVKTYDGSIGPPPSFNLDKTYNNFTQNCEKKNEYIKVKRIFINYENEKYGLAEFELWLR
jgi:hypothetical protein